MAYLPDTNIVLRLVNKKDPLHQIVSQAIERLERNGEELVIIPQIIVEFWTVATRPTNVNGLGMTTDEAEKELENLQKLFTLLPDNEQSSMNGKRLLSNTKSAERRRTMRESRRQ